ncbi:unnamed protein product [Arctia plantaginis]|uniref:Fucosyltransferase n=1 Tax=Arctia plantaginis TaxID=874455 RepID=A0A8S1B0Z8_ARCPL|nr:unnamed protein product [Arctia plantaginis]
MICVPTRTSLLGDIRYFDGILFNVKDLDKTTWDLPTLRSPIQKYIFAANYSAEEYPVCSPIYDGYFNWTWSYRLDSLIPYSYITVYNLNYEDLGFDLHWNKVMKPIDERLKSMLQSKSKAAAIFLDNCDSSSTREVLLKQLQRELAKYNLTVDVFGKCGTIRCGRKNINSFYYKLKTTYYFYLALEEVIAKDYITANIITAYKHNAVPIVYSGADYNRHIPPYSYLDLRQLGVTVLAKKMHRIIQNKEMYYDFFRWRNHYIVKETMGMDFCTLCEIMNNPAWLSAKLSVTTFRKWWNPNYEQRCKRHENFIF